MYQFCPAVIFRGLSAAPAGGPSSKSLSFAAMTRSSLAALVAARFGAGSAPGFGRVRPEVVLALVASLARQLLLCFLASFALALLCRRDGRRDGGSSLAQFSSL